MICPKCGRNMDSSYNFCTNCGNRLESNEQMKIVIINKMMKMYLGSDKKLVKDNSPFIKYNYNPFLLSLLKENKEDIVINYDFEKFEVMKKYNTILEYEGYYITYYDLLRINYYSL